MNKRSKKAILDYRSSEQAQNLLIEAGFEPVLTCEIKDIYNSVKGHADLQIVKIDDNTVVVCPEFYDYYKSKLNCNVIKGSKYIGSTYPDNIIYNAAVMSKFAIHNFNFTDPFLRDYIIKKSLVEINVKQGYSKCSICIISDNAIITDDEGIYKKVSEYEIDALKIDKGSVKLIDFEYGFFGGATGLYKNTLYLNGQIESHCNCNKIVDFCKLHNVDIKELNTERLTDIGSIIFI